MPRAPRTDAADYVYHVLNRANARVKIFDSEKSYRLFEKTLEEAVDKFAMRLLAYCIMPNHWHLVLYPKRDGDISVFMSWLSNTHTRRWHAQNDTVGGGHLYQGRYKSFIVQNDDHFLTLVRYVERNAKRANLIERAEDWRWSSVWRREHGSLKECSLLSEWPAPMPHEYLRWLNEAQTSAEEEAIKLSVKRGNPFGEAAWNYGIIQKFNLQSTVSSRGRPPESVDNKGG